MTFAHKIIDFTFMFDFVLFSLSSMAAFSERIRMRAAPRLEPSSIFKTVYNLLCADSNLFHLVGGYRVQTAAERIELNQINVVPSFPRNQQPDTVS